MSALTRDEIIAAATQLPEKVETIAEWGGPIRFRGIGAGHRLAILAALAGADTDRSVHASVMLNLVAMSIVDEAGERMFDTEEGRNLVATFDPRGFLAALKVAQELSGMTPTKEGEEPAPL